MAASKEMITKNAELVFKLLKELPKDRQEVLTKLLDGSLGETYFTAPASTEVGYHSCYAGGLTAHSLNVVSNLKKLCDTLCPNKYDNATLIFLGLFHDFGKVGDGNNEFYLEKDSKWHKDRGILYEVNPQCTRMPMGERTIYLLQSVGIRLTEEEFVALRLVEAEVQESSYYRYHEPTLALLLQWANRWSIQQEKESA
jgi:hypothetical protein